MPRIARPTTIGLALLATTAATALAVAPAQAATGGVASVYGSSKVQYKAAHGKRNRVVITRSGNTLTIDDAVTVKPGKGCRKVDRTRVRCTTRTAPTRVRISTYDRNDSIVNDTDVRMTADSGTGNDRVYGGSRGDTILGFAGADKLYGRGGNDALDGLFGNDVVDGGDGDDKISDGDGNDILHGGNGWDYIWGEAGNDKIYGDGGPDILEGGPGRDRVDGGYGDDFLEGDDCSLGADFGPCVAADLLIGGSGVDTADYSGSTDPVVVDLDGASGDDGQAGEHDTVAADVENLRGGMRNDRLTGNGGTNYLDGGVGNDIVRGGGGDDRLDGSEGRDRLYGDAGDDVLDGDDAGPAAADRLDGGTNSASGDQCLATARDTEVGCEH